MSAIRYRHHSDCRGERMGEPRIGREGDLLVSCRNCKMLTILPSAPIPEPEPVPVVVSGYRCRAHHDQAVTWRGKGCPPCTAEPQQSRNARLKRHGERKEAELQ